MKKSAKHKQCRTLHQLPKSHAMTSRATPLIPPEHHHRPMKGPVIFTGVGLTGSAIIAVLIMVCKYGVRGRAPVTTGAGAAASNPEERGPIGVDVTKLPEFSYTESARRSSGVDEEQCSVCLGTVQPGEKVRRLPLCKHLYHVECIDMWLSSHTTCPLCRADVEPPGDDGEAAPAEHQEQALPV